MITAALEDRGELEARRRILVPDSAHGTNPATAAMAGYSVTHLPTAEDGSLDRATIEQELDETVAAVMVTVPNTLGLWENGIEQVAQLIHDAGAYLYADGANLNAIMGRVRYGDLGFRRRPPESPQELQHSARRRRPRSRAGLLHRGTGPISTHADPRGRR